MPNAPASQPPAAAAAPAVSPAVQRDLRILIRFVEVFCQGRHGQAPRQAASMPKLDIAALAGREVLLCADCRRLLSHGLVKRLACPMNPKPACKHCPNHCYHPRYRQAMRQVMAYSGRKLVLRGRLDYLLHLLF